jgi:hypothetical protein
LDDYDLRQLVVRCIDLVVTNQGAFDDELSPDRLIDLLTAAARQQLPMDAGRRWTRVAQHVVTGLLNTDQGQHFSATYIETGEPGDEWTSTRDFAFRLLELKDGSEGTRVVATDAAVMLFLQALDVDLADQQAALTVVMQRQMEDGRFDKARRTAWQARETAQAYTTVISEAIDDTRRDLSAVDWAHDMPARLDDARTHVSAQIPVEENLLALARAGAETDDPDIAADCADIEAAVRVCQQAHIHLERRIMAAIPAFLDAQAAQRLRRRALSLTWRPTDDLLRPVLGFEPAAVNGVTDAFASGLLLDVPCTGSADALIAALLRPPTAREQIPGAVDRPGELVEVDEDNLDAGVAVAAASVFATAVATPRRLSELLAAARSAPEGPPAGIDTVTDTVWAGALWLFVSPYGAADDGERLHGDLAAVLGHLGATDDGTALDDDRYHGADLLIAARTEGPGHG